MIQTLRPVSLIHARIERKQVLGSLISETEPDVLGDEQGKQTRLAARTESALFRRRHNRRSAVNAGIVLVPGIHGRSRTACGRRACRTMLNAFVRFGGIL